MKPPQLRLYQKERETFHALQALNQRIYHDDALHNQRIRNQFRQKRWKSNNNNNNNPQQQQQRKPPPGKRPRFSIFEQQPLSPRKRHRKSMLHSEQQKQQQHDSIQLDEIGSSFTSKRMPSSTRRDKQNVTETVDLTQEITPTTKPVKRLFIMTTTTTTTATTTTTTKTLLGGGDKPPPPPLMTDLSTKMKNANSDIGLSSLLASYNTSSSDDDDDDDDDDDEIQE